MRSSRILALEQRYIVKEDPVEDGPEETVNLFFSANEPRLEDVVNSVSVAMEQFNHYSHIKKLVLESSEVSSHTFSFLKREMLKSNNYLGFDDTIFIANESYHYSNSKSLALEGIGSFLKKIWDSIVNGFKWIVNKVKNFFGFGERNTDHIRSLEKQLSLINKEIENVIRGFPDVDPNELQQYHPLLISDVFKNNAPILHEAYFKIQRYKKYVSLHQSSLSIENMFELSIKELQLAINNLLSIVGNKSPTSVFIKSLSNRGSELDDLLKNTPITQFPEYQEYVSGLKNSKLALGALQGILTYDKDNKAFANFNLPQEGSSKIAYYLPILHSLSPHFISLVKDDTKEDSVFKDNVLSLGICYTDTSSISDDEISKEMITIVTPNTLLAMTKHNYAYFSKCLEGIATLDKETKETLSKLDILTKQLEKLDVDGVNLPMIEVLGVVLKTISSYKSVGARLVSTVELLETVMNNYYDICLTVHRNISTSTKKEDILA